MRNNTYKYRKKKQSGIDFSRFTYEELQEIQKNLTKYFSKLKQERSIPLSLFKTSLAPLETVVKFLIENQSLSIKEVSLLLKRSPKTIWQAYNFAKKKYLKKFTVKQKQFLIPISIFSVSKLSILESLVSYLKEVQNLKFYQIAGLLDRDQRTIWTVYSRARRKNAK